MTVVPDTTRRRADRWTTTHLGRRQALADASTPIATTRHRRPGLTVATVVVAMIVLHHRHATSRLAISHLEMRRSILEKEVMDETMTAVVTATGNSYSFFRSYPHCCYGVCAVQCIT